MEETEECFYFRMSRRRETNSQGTSQQLQQQLQQQLTLLRGTSRRSPKTNRSARYIWAVTFSIIPTKNRCFHGVPIPSCA